MLSDLLEALATTIDLRAFVARMLLAAVFGFLAAVISGAWLGNSGQVGRLIRILPVLAVGMAFMTSVLASSHALAIGMVGALSMVRFRMLNLDPKSAVAVLASVALGLAAGAGSLPVGLLFLLTLALVLMVINRSDARRRSFAKIMVSGKTEEVLKIIQDAAAHFPGMKTKHFQGENEWSEWEIQIQGETQYGIADVASFFVGRAIDAKIRIVHAE